MCALTRRPMESLYPLNLRVDHVEELLSQVLDILMVPQAHHTRGWRSRGWRSRAEVIVRHKILRPVASRREVTGIGRRPSVQVRLLCGCVVNAPTTIGRR